MTKSKIEILENYLKEKKVAVTKNKMAQDTGLKTSLIDRYCRILRKRKVIGWEYRKYWGTKIEEEKE